MTVVHGVGDRGVRAGRQLVRGVVAVGGGCAIYRLTGPVAVFARIGIRAGRATTALRAVRIGVAIAANSAGGTGGGQAVGQVVGIGPCAAAGAEGCGIGEDLAGLAVSIGVGDHLAALDGVAVRVNVAVRWVIPNALGDSGRRIGDGTQPPILVVVWLCQTSATECLAGQLAVVVVCICFGAECSAIATDAAQVVVGRCSGVTVDVFVANGAAE